MHVSFYPIMTNNVFPPPDDKGDPFDDNSKDPVERALDKFGESVSSIFGAFGKRKPTPKNAADEKPTLDTLFAHISKDNAEGVRKVLAAGIDPNTFSHDGSTALLLATRRDLPHIARILIEAGADPKRGADKKSDVHPIEVAINYGHARMVELLAAHGGYTPGEMVNGRTQLMRAVEKGKVDLVLALLRASGKGGEIAGEEETNVLARAIERYNFPLAESLLDIPSLATQINNVTIGNGSTLLMTAVEKRQLSLVRKLVDKGAFVNRAVDGVTPIVVAIQKTDADIIAVLAAAGAELNALDHPALCLLANIPAKTNDDDIRCILKTLLGFGADPERANIDGMPALHLSILAQNTILYTGLIDAGADIDRYDTHQMTPLAYAVMKKDASLIQILLNRNADPNKVLGYSGRTALMLAAERDHKIALELLLAAGADPTCTDAAGKSAASYARGRSQHDGLEMIEHALNDKLRGFGRKRPSGGDTHFLP